MNKFEDIQTFVAVVDAGTFTAAAERLGTAKSAVSRRVSALEERLGVQLLRRTTRTLNLTETGRSYYEHGSRILADLDEAEAAVQQEHGELQGRVRLALPLSFGVRHMCGPIAAFTKQHPMVEFDLDLNDRRVDLIEDGFDLALRIGRLPDSSLIARRLFDVRGVICASPNYLGMHGTPAVPDDLKSHRCLAYSNLENPRKWSYETENGDHGSVEIKPALTASSGDYLCNAAAHGQGIVIQPTFIAAEAIRNGHLVPILNAYRFSVSQAYAVYAPARHLSYRVRAFIDFLAARFAGTPPWDRDIEYASGSNKTVVGPV